MERNDKKYRIIPEETKGDEACQTRHRLMARVVAAAVSLWLMLQSSLANAAEKVKIGVIGILAEAGLYVAAERGYFTKEGLDVEFVKGLFGPDAFLRSRPDKSTRSVAPSARK